MAEKYSSFFKFDLVVYLGERVGKCTKPDNHGSDTNKRYREKVQGGGGRSDSVSKIMSVT